MGHVEIDHVIPMELTQLPLDQVAHDQAMTATEELAQDQMPIPREQPPVFAKCTLNQDVVRDCLFIGGVVAENAQPAREATEHRIGYEALGLLS